MQYLLTPHVSAIPPFAWWEGAFTEEELNWLQQKAKEAKQNANVGSGVVDENIRRSKVAWLENNPNTKWLFKRLADVASRVNAEHFRFDLTGFGEELQLTNYDQTENGMYGWHQDCASEGIRVSRKISLAVQLANPSEYEGGDLQILSSGAPMNVRKQRGLIAIFPSYVVHQVTPVTQGSRQSLVSWVSGPAFR